MNLRSSLALLILVIVSVTTAKAQSAHEIIKSGNDLVAKQKYELAIKQYERVSSREGDSYAQAVYNIGVCYYHLFRDADSVVLFKRALALKQGNYPRASFAMGVALEGLGELTEAKQAYEQSISTSRGEYGPAYFQLGTMVANEGDFKAAADLFRTAAERAGKHVPASHNNLGVMLARMGLLADAEKQFIISVKETNGEFADAVQNLRLCRTLQASTMQTAVSDLRLSVFSAFGR